MAKKLKGLPFVVQPRLKPVIERLGSDLSGVIEIERKGYLTVAEKSIVQHSMKEETGLADAFMIAREVGAKVNKTAEEVFSDISADPQPEYILEHSELIAKAMNCMLAHEEKLRLVAATALILTRVSPDWDPSDTISLHPDLQADLYKLYIDEDRKCVDALEDAIKEIDGAQENASGKG